MGQVHGTKAALPHLKREGRGALVHVTSLEAKRAFPFHSAYSAAKHGVDGFLEALRVELRHDGIPIAVTQVMPATIDTPIFDKARTKVGRKPMGAPLAYHPGTVADMLLHAAEHGGGDYYAGGFARLIGVQQRTAPWLLDAVFPTDLGRRGLMTRKPKDEAAPDNLYARDPRARHRPGWAPGAQTQRHELDRASGQPIRTPAGGDAPSDRKPRRRGRAARAPFRIRGSTLIPVLARGGRPDERRTAR